MTKQKITQTHCYSNGKYTARLSNSGSSWIIKMGNVKVGEYDTGTLLVRQGGMVFADVKSDFERLQGLFLQLDAVDKDRLRIDPEIKIVC